MLSNFTNGPYVHAFAWTTPRYEVHTCDSSNCAAVAPAVTFEPGVAPRRIGAVPFDQMMADLPTPLMRASGVPRARSASKSAVFGGLVGKALIKSAAAALSNDGDRMGVAVVSSSSIIPIFWQFEGVGVSDSWSHTDTMLLPASIPSAVGTAASMVTGSHAAAVTFGDGAFGMCSAIEHAYLAFAHDRADYFMLLGAEEANKPMRDALIMLDDEREIMDGCAGALLSRTPLASTDWQVCALAWVPVDELVYIAEPWSTAPRVHVSMGSRLMAYTSMLMPFALHKAMTSDGETALVEFQVAERGSFMLALRRQDGPCKASVFA